MSKKTLKEQVEDDINLALQTIEDILSEIKDVENESDNVGLDFSYVYKYLDDLKDHIKDIDGTFYDFSNKIDDVYDKLNELL